MRPLSRPRLRLLTARRPRRRRPSALTPAPATLGSPGVRTGRRPGVTRLRPPRRGPSGGRERSGSRESTPGRGDGAGELSFAARRGPRHARRGGRPAHTFGQETTARGRSRSRARGRFEQGRLRRFRAPRRERALRAADRERGLARRGRRWPDEPARRTCVRSRAGLGNVSARLGRRADEQRRQRIRQLRVPRTRSTARATRRAGTRKAAARPGAGRRSASGRRQGSPPTGRRSRRTSGTPGGCRDRRRAFPAAPPLPRPRAGRR